MRVFKGFNSSGGQVCPVCNTSKDTETVLVPIPGTESDGLVQCSQVHKKCYDLVVEMNEQEEGEVTGALEPTSYDLAGGPALEGTVG